jgi:hypothetical protein
MPKIHGRVVEACKAQTQWLWIETGSCQKRGLALLGVERRSARYGVRMLTCQHLEVAVMLGGVCWTLIGHAVTTILPHTAAVLMPKRLL